MKIGTKENLTLSLIRIQETINEGLNSTPTIDCCLLSGSLGDANGFKS